MSKVAIEGNVSGTGTLTIAAPNTNTNRTITLPDATGTLALAGGASDKIEEGNSKVEVTDAGTGKVEITVDAVEVADFTTGAIVFNETGANQDFRVEGDTEANLLFVDASADKVGIGTNAPVVTLDVRQASNDCILRLKATSGVTADKNTYELRTVGAAGFEGFFIRTANDANNSFANVLQFNPVNFLHVSNTGVIPDGLGSRHYFTSNNASNPTLFLRADSASLSGTDVFFIRGNTNTTNNTFRLIAANNGNDTGVFNVRDSGNVVNTNNSYGSSSDIKLKQDIVDATSQWDDIKNIRIRKYRFKNNPTAPLNIGVIAQELETISPGLVDSEDDYEEVKILVLDEKGESILNEDGTPQIKTQRNPLGTTTKAVKYSVLYMKAVKALQEAIERIETLEAKVAALENNNA